MSLNSSKLIFTTCVCSFCSCLSVSRVDGTRLSSQPKLLLEEDRESGIGSTLDLSSSFDDYNQHTDHQSNACSHRAADRLPEEKGTRVTWGIKSHIHLSLKRQISRAAEAEPHAQKTHGGQWDLTVWATKAKSCCPSAAFGCIWVMQYIRWLSSRHVRLLTEPISHPEHRNHKNN